MSESSTIAAVRALIGDTPRWVQGETLGIGNGARTVFQLAQYPQCGTTWQVWVDGVDVSEDVTLDATMGLVTLSEAPDDGAVITTDYSCAQLSDAAIGSQLDAVNDNLLLASSRCLEVLLLDPVSMTRLSIDGMILDPGGRMAALQALSADYRKRGTYGQLQSRIDAAEWGDA